MTIIQPDGQFRRKIPKSDLCPVSVDDKDARESIKVTLANLSVLKRKLFPRLSDIKINVQKNVLVYIPFTVRGNEFIHAEYGFGIQRNAIRQF